MFKALTLCVNVIVAFKQGMNPTKTAECSHYAAQYDIDFQAAEQQLKPHSLKTSYIALMWVLYTNSSTALSVLALALQH